MLVLFISGLICCHSSDIVKKYLAQTMKIGPRMTFFLNISNLSKNYLIDFFYSVSNFGTDMVQLKYQRAKRLKFSFLIEVLQMLKMH